MEHATDDTFGVLLRRFRKDAGLTQEELAERARVSVRGVSDLERGVSRAPYRATVLQLANALELSASDRAVLMATARKQVTGTGHLVSRIPIPPTPLVGRERELAELVRFLATPTLRLITLTGPGGVGKTRLALAVATELQHRSGGAIHFVSLAPLNDPLLVPSTIAEVLGLREAPKRPVTKSLIAFLRDEEVTLLLDNFEHLPSAADVVAALLVGCPLLRVMATSRAALHVQGEQEYPVQPLVAPDPRHASPVQALLEYPAIELFVQRASAVQPEFHLGNANAGTVANICYRLDGLPLAIELAAARIKVFPPQALLARLDRRLPILTGGPRDLPARLRTMRDAIAWSYDLLNDTEQTLFRRLAVFSGGCTLEAAEAVSEGVGDLAVDTLEGLSSLVNKSLLTVRDTPGERDQLRFFMLETIREFALEQLVSSSEAGAAFGEHAGYFLVLAQRAERALNGSKQSTWLDRLEREHDNLRATLLRAERADNIGLGLELLGLLWPFWWARNHYDEAQKWLDAFLPRAESVATTPSVHARALHAAGVLVGMRGDIERALSLLRQALAQARQAEDGTCIAATLCMLGATEQGRGHYHQAEEALNEALIMYQQLDDRAGTCATLSRLAGGARYQGDFERAVSRYREALALGRMIGDARRVADILARLGSVESERGSPTQSRSFYEEARALHEQLGDMAGIGDILLRSGETTVNAGEFAEATALLEESLNVFGPLGNSYAVAYVHLYQAEAALGIGNVAGAEALAMQSLEFFRDIGDRRCAADALLQLADVARERQSEAEALNLYRESLALHRALNTRPQIARCLERMVVLACEQGLNQRAARLHGAAASLRDDMKSDMPPADCGRYMRCLETLRDEMGDARFVASQAEGRAMSAEQAIAYALEEVRVCEGAG